MPVLVEILPSVYLITNSRGSCLAHGNAKYRALKENILWPDDAIECPRSLSTLVQIRLMTKSLPEPIVTYCKLFHKEQTLVICELIYNKHNLWEMHLKAPSAKYCPFRLGPSVLTLWTKLKICIYTDIPHPLGTTGFWYHWCITHYNLIFWLIKTIQCYSFHRFKLISRFLSTGF